MPVYLTESDDTSLSTELRVVGLGQGEYDRKKAPAHISPSCSGIMSASGTLLGANGSREITWWLGELQEKWGREREGGCMRGED